jgi:hypothetical protein
MFTYLLGPFLAMLPRRWRNALPLAGSIHWSRAGALSGLLESLLASVAMVYWYSHTVMVWIDHAAGAALQGKMGPEVKLEEIGFAAWAIMVVHPLTWLIAYFAVEGAVRFSSSAFSGSVPGILPLAVVDGLFRKLFGLDRDSLDPREQRQAFSSVSSSVKEKILAAAVPAGADELRSLKDGEREILEIHCSRRKDDWNPPRVVRCEDKYYRLEECRSGKTPRPFVYVLCRLAAGVPGRNVLLYSPQHAVLQSKR